MIKKCGFRRMSKNFVLTVKVQFTLKEIYAYFL